MRKHSIILFVSMLAFMSCVYPFTPDIKDEDIPKVVVDGNLLIGEVSTFKVAPVFPLNTDGSMTGMNHIPVKLWAVDSEGSIYESFPDGNAYCIDLTDAPDDRLYSLHVQYGDKEYMSEAAPVRKGCSIDSLKYSIDSGIMTFTMDYTGQKDSGYLIDFTEVWEYHSLYYASVKYDIASDSLIRMPDDERHYYCWNSRSSISSVPSTTEGLSSTSVKGVKFHSMNNLDRRISYVYSIEAYLTPVDGDSYLYMENLLKTSNVTGSLFSPIPSEMPGNLICTTDPQDYAIGYVNVAKREKKRLFVYNSKTHFYKESPQKDTGFDIYPMELWSSIYRNGLLPIGGDENLGYGWAYARCVDCVKEGGTTKRPDFWPAD